MLIQVGPLEEHTTTIEKRDAEQANLADDFHTDNGLVICRFQNIFRGDPVNWEQALNPRFTHKEREL